MLGPKLGFNVGVIQFTDECVCPSLAGVVRDVSVVLAVPLSPLRVTANAGVV